MKHKPVVAALLLFAPLTACGSAQAGDSSTVTVTVGYQSKTINTVTAGTLLRSLGYFEKQLNSLHDGHTYKVDWQDYATGAPITAQMTAGKIDIGSMGDFPLLINAARGKQLGKPTRLVSVTGYNLRGGLNTIVTSPTRTSPHSTTCAERRSPRASAPPPTALSYGPSSAPASTPTRASRSSTSSPP